MSKKHQLIFTILTCTAVSFSCKENKPNDKKPFIDNIVEFAVAQTNLMEAAVGEPNGENYPRTMGDNGELITTNMYDWTSGFYPGNLWYLFELTGDTIWKSRAEKWTDSLEPLKTFTQHHDLGFMMYCSYGNAERLAPNTKYKDILIESANSLASRFNEKTNTIKSWNYRKAWNDSTDWYYPVIIDNLMNLEMLFYASKVSNDKKFYNIAVKHADATLKNHFRDDFSSYHVVNYDTISGVALNQATFQGFSDNSTWARGQAWAIYGFTMLYRETKAPKYLNAAIKATDWYLARLPEDLIPLWDFNVGETGYTPDKMSYAVHFQKQLKDVSAGAVVSSALFELGQITDNKTYLDKAEKMLQSLASPAYRAELGTNADFLLMHSVGSIPHNVEIDRPLVYADYYFLEALTRYRKLNQ